MDILDKERLKECRLKLGITKQEAAKRVQISQPAYLFFLIETCKNLNASQLTRLTDYAKALSNAAPDSEK